MRFACAKVHQMAIEFQDNRTIAGDKANLAQPGLQQAALRGGGKEMDGNLERDFITIQTSSG